MPFVELDEFRVSGRRNQTKYVTESEMYQKLIASGGVPPPAPDVMQPISKKEWLAQLRGWENSIKDLATRSGGGGAGGSSPQRYQPPSQQPQSLSPPSQGHHQLYQPPAVGGGSYHAVHQLQGTASPQPVSNYHQHHHQQQPQPQPQQQQQQQQPAFHHHHTQGYYQSPPQASMQQVATASHQLPPPVPVPMSQSQSGELPSQDSVVLEGSVTSSSGSVPKFMLKRPRQFNVAAASPSSSSQSTQPILGQIQQPDDEKDITMIDDNINNNISNCLDIQPVGSGVPMSPLTPASTGSSTPGPSEEEVINGKWTTSPKGPSTPQHWRHFHPARKGSFAHNGASTVPVTPAVPNQTPVCDHSLTSAFTSCDGGYPADDIYEPMSPGTTSRILKLLKDRRILSEGTKKVAFDVDNTVAASDE
eukprot:TRINITY_DN2059_c0_g1_i1.p1 TRINITY_DN2059_c0_g1~~TRINITY_DN2059_c0_g1_i1.p1  ORF type:complete len:432 (+),score=99.82 TRINITY_DN2059_c0_g1_i1:45-1298(+)